MRSFKDFVNDDNKVFFNTDEFSEIHDIAGYKCNIIFTNENKTKADGRLNDNYINVENFSFLVKKEEICFKPMPDNLISFDYRSYLIVDVTENIDTFEIFLEANMR